MAADGMLRLLWITEVVVRFLWTGLPETGYIYPDEFFQATEIAAGDIFGFKHTRTWEWNENFPLRSPFFPYAIGGVPFYFLKSLFASCDITSRILIVAPRLVMTTASLSIDFVVFKICKHLGMDPWCSLVILGNSFVTLVFHTRTFSNSAESILFASLLLLVISSMANRDHECSKRCFGRFFLIGFLTSVGIWIRPTFLAFACVPLLWWLVDICSFHLLVDKNITQILQHVLSQCIVLGCGGFASIIILTMVDSYYFGYFQQGKIVLTPLNFVQYNLDSNSLKEHGLHPRIMHFTVNLPLLFGPKALCLYAVTTNMAVSKSFLDKVKALFSTRNLASNKKTDNNYKDSFIWSLLFCSIVVPMSILSCFPHQEPRFIIPVLFPLVILFSHCLSRSSFSFVAVLSLLIWNMFGCIIFGLMHQGGLYPCMEYLAKYLKNAQDLRPSATEFNLIFYHTYMPPQHLLAWPSSHQNDTSLHHSLNIHDLKGSSSHELMNHLQKLIEKFEPSDRKYEVKQ